MGSSLTSLPLSAMNAIPFRTLLSLPLIALVLTACGGTGEPTDNAAVASAPAQTAGVTHVVDLSVDRSASGRNPLPDCAPEGCNRLRIIDGNAEAYRIDAMRRAAQGS